MKKNKYLTNQELLQELKARLPNFTQDEIYTLLAIIQPQQENILKIVQEINPKIHHLIIKEQEKLEQEKTDKKAEKVKKSL